MFGWNTSTGIKKGVEEAIPTEVRATASAGSEALPAGDRIGDVLLSEGKVTREQLDLALTMQRNDTRRIGDILLPLGYVTAEYLAQALAKQMKLASVRFPVRHLPEGGPSFYEAVGCDRCGGTGYMGRMGIYEMMLVTDQIKELVLKRVSTGELGRLAEQSGMVRLRDDGLIKAARGATTIEEVLRTVV